MGTGPSCLGGERDLHGILLRSNAAAATHAALLELISRKPYLTRKVHPLHHWVNRCLAELRQELFAEAQNHLERIQAAIAADSKCLRDTFNKFDLDRSGQLEVEEFRHFVSYVGFGPHTVEAVVREADRDKSGRVTIEEFEAFVGRVGGIEALFEQVRDVVAQTADNAEPGLLPGSRVRAHCYDGGIKSAHAWDAHVLELNADGHTAKLDFGGALPHGGQSGQQDVPRQWITEDEGLVSALSEIGILHDSQHYWTVLLPPSEQYAVRALETCQREAIFGVRQQATENHNSAISQLVQRFNAISISRNKLWAVLTWVRDLAPIIVHVDLDAVGEFLEVDTHYRNQFETASSKGLLCPQKREEWERNLFGTCYDDALPFHRPKYGVLDVMNDHRGVLCARDYGDSYLVLKNSRLRCTFAPLDSGGIGGSRLAVLDQYAHVLLEFSDDELREVSRVANAEEGSNERIGDSSKLDGFNYKEAQIHGELDLNKHVKRLVVHPRHLVDGFNESRIRNVCDKHGWELLWMHDERKRRIYEERESRDSRVLEMSWASEAYINFPAA